MDCPQSETRSLTAKGYLVFPKVVPEELCQAVIRDSMSHTRDGTEGIDRNGMVEMYHYQSMWEVRQHPAVHAAFASIFGTEKLWVSIDRVGFKPGLGYESIENLKKQYEQPYGFIHWDININQRPRPLAVQGLVALCDTNDRMGGFQCVPDLYRELDSWLADLPTRKAVFNYLHMAANHVHELLPAGWEKFRTELGRWSVERVPLQAGDLLIWDSFLPHGNGVNLTDRHRFCQYVTMTLPGDERLATERISCWRKNAPPSDWAFPGDPRLLETMQPAANLTKLGLRLLGLGVWE